MCGAYWKEDSELSDNLECRYLDATMEVVAEFASMLADGIYYFCRSFMLCGLTDLVSRPCFYTLINSSWKISLRRWFLEHGKKVFEKLSRFNFFLYAATSIFSKWNLFMFTGYLTPDRYFSHEVTSKITNYRVQITVVSKGQIAFTCLCKDNSKPVFFPSLLSGNPALLSFFVLSHF